MNSAPKNLKLIVTEGDSADKARLVDFYSQTYLRDDPVVRAAGIEDLTELKQFLDTSLKSLHSVLLTDREGTIVMAAASGGPVTYTTAAQMRLYADRDMKDDRSRRLVHLWASITSESDMLNRLHVPALWDISYISTAPQMRRYGLARFLLVQHRRLASKLGYPVLCLECTNQCLVRAAQKMGFQGMEGRSLDSYLNPSGESWISAPPHLQVQVFCRMLGGKVEPDFRLQ
ncbi:hypothetical protein J6590_007795 [Homalodisca vitripennis]|nr:hypothetical protein J6590_007795 [Homalodisca vitripennis]